MGTKPENYRKRVTKLESFTRVVVGEMMMIHIIQSKTQMTTSALNVSVKKNEALLAAAAVQDVYVVSIYNSFSWQTHAMSSQADHVLG